MSGPAFDLLEEKRKKIANELAKLEKQVRRLGRGRADHRRSFPWTPDVDTQSLDPDADI